MGKKILVVVATFKDKGSQSMFFVVADELKKRFGDCQIYFACNGEQYNESNYIFKKLIYTKQQQDMLLGDRVNLLSNITKLIRKKDDSSANGEELQKIFSMLDLIIDISDYVLAAKSSIPEHNAYLNNIKIAKKFNIPIIYMPQSFGPFNNYSADNMYIMGDMKDLLFYPKAIFAREQEGYDDLIGYFGLDNVRQSPDLVLQNKGINIMNVCSGAYEPIIPDIKAGNNVAIIPNNHNFSKKVANSSYALYFRMIEKLLEAKKEVYIFCFASSDLEVCKKLASLFSYNDSVHLIEQEFDCIEYDFIVRYFDFVICSRYHGCVHAYRNLIPSLIIGSTIRYRALAKLMDQEKYYFDILADRFDERALIDALDSMIKHRDEEIEVIRPRLEEVQSSNCFDVLDELGW